MNPTDLGLLIDDDELYVRTLQRSLSRRGLETRTATGIAEALRVAEEIRPAFALVDLRLGEDSGLTLIRPLRALRADMRILLVTGYASVATAVEAIKRGADDYLPKPATAPMILRTLGLVKPESVTIETTMTPLHRLEWEHIHQALHETGGNVSAAHAEGRNDRLRIINNHCPFGEVANDHPVICAVDRGMVRGMLGELYDAESADQPVDVTTESSLAAGDTFCTTAV